MKRVDKPAPVTVTIEFTEEEAEIICGLVGGVVGFSQPVEDLFFLLNKSLPHRKTSFSDHFEGDVKVKQ